MEDDHLSISQESENTLCMDSLLKELTTIAVKHRIPNSHMDQVVGAFYRHARDDLETRKAKVEAAGGDSSTIIPSAFGKLL
jgi:hypothetical protein